MPDPSHQPPWLLLIYQLPSRRSNPRVKTWRRLQRLGAVGLKNTAYILPNSPQAREDFEWIKSEIAALKGQANVFALDSVDRLSSDEIVGAFRDARQKDFETIRREAERLLVKSKTALTRRDSARRRAERSARLLHERLNELMAIDFFGAPGRDEATAALEELDRLLAGGTARSRSFQERREQLMAESFHDRTWVTRPRPGIDRMSSAWLIRRFIDPRAKFVFADRAEEAPTAVPFDMFGVEFGHQGNHCTFETLTGRLGVANPALEWLGRIVHNLDLKDEPGSVPEAVAVGRLVDGLRQMYQDDHELLERGMATFEALYRSFGDQALGGKGPTKSSGQRGGTSRRPPR